MAIPFYEHKHREDLAKVGAACYAMGVVTTLLIVVGYLL